jgi:hypothetical protein
MAKYVALTEQQIYLAADDFLKIVTIHQNWPAATDINPIQKKALADLLVSAGFELSGFETKGSQYEGNVGQYPQNLLSNIIVMNKDGEFHDRATGWLYCVTALVVQDLATDGYDRAVQNLESQIRRSLPLEPILLGEENGYLLEFPPEIKSSGTRFGYLLTHTRDPHYLPSHSTIGIHGYLCKGHMQIKPCSDTHHVLVCPVCFLRATIPVDTRTYGELRKHFTK